MDEGNEARSSGIITLYLLISLSLLLLLIDSIEAFQLITIWSKSLKLSKEVFEACLKWEVIYRSVSCVFSMASGLTAFLMSLAVLSHFKGYNIKPFVSVLFRYLYMLFGCVLLGTCLIAYWHFNSFFKVCDRNLIETGNGNLEASKIFGMSNFISVFVFTLISLTIVIFVMGSYIGIFFRRSYNKKYGGSELYIKIFWWMLIKKTNTKDLLRKAIDSHNQAGNNYDPFDLNSDSNGNQNIIDQNQGLNNNQRIENELIV